MASSRILLLEEAVGRQGEIRAGLGREGYDVAAYPTGQDFMRRLERGGVDIILLDLSAENQDGFGLIGKIRIRTDAPIIVISDTDDLVRRLAGLEMGADDYLSVPFQFRELSVRIRVQLRRSRVKIRAQGNEVSSRLSFGAWSLDPQRMQIFDQHNRAGCLTVKEFRLLATFVAAKNRVLSRAQLLDATNMNDLDITDRAVDTQITRLRKKIGDVDARIIQSVRGVGYVLVDEAAVISTAVSGPSAPAAGRL